MRYLTIFVLLMFFRVSEHSVSGMEGGAYRGGPAGLQGLFVLQQLQKQANTLLRTGQLSNSSKAGHHIKFVLMQMVGMSLLPESPVWLKWKGNSLAAEAASRRLLGSSHEDLVASQAEDGESEPLVPASANEVPCQPMTKGYRESPEPLCTS